MAISIGDAVVNIFGDDSKLKETLTQTGDKIKGLGTKVTAMGGVITAGFGAVVKTFADAGDQIQKMALRTGFSTEALSEWKHAAELSGTSIEGLENGVRKMGSFLEDAKDGLATSKVAMDKLGLGVEDFKGKSPEESFNLFAEAIGGIENPMSRAALAQDVFGKSGTQLLPMFSAGKEGMEAMKAEARELGLVFSQDAANASAEFNDNLARLGGAFTGVRNAIAEQLVPILIPLLEKLKDGVVRVREWAEAHPELFEKIVKFTAIVGGLMVVLGPIIVVLGTIVGSLGTLIGAVGPVIAILGSLGTAVSTVGTVLAAIASPIGLAIAAIVSIPLSIASIVKTITEYWDEIERTTRDVWNGIKGFFVGIWDGIKSVFMGGVDGIKAIGMGYVNFYIHLWDETKRIWGGIVDAIMNPLETIKSGMDKATGFFRNLFGASLWPDYFQNLEQSSETHFSGMATAVDDNLSKSRDSMDKFTEKLAETSQKMAAITSIGGLPKSKESLEKVRETIEKLEAMAKKAAPNMVDYYMDLIALQKEQEKEILESLENEEEAMDDAFGNSWFPQLLKKGVDAAEKHLPQLANAFDNANQKIKAGLGAMNSSLEDGVSGLKPRDTEKSKKGFDKLRDGATAGLEKIKQATGGVSEALGAAGRAAEMTALGTAKSFLTTAELISNSLLSIQLNSARLESTLFRRNDLASTIGVLNSQISQRQSAALANTATGGDFNVGGITVEGGNSSFEIAAEIKRQLQNLNNQTLVGYNRK